MDNKTLTTIIVQDCLQLRQFLEKRETGKRYIKW